MGLSMKNAEGKGGYATVWSITEDHGTWLTASVSTSYKKKDGSGYETDFQDGYVQFMFDAYEKIKNMKFPEKGGVRIQITRLDVTAKYNKETNKKFMNVKIFDFDIPDFGNGEKPSETASAAKKTAAKPKKEAEPQTDEQDEDLPF